MIDFRKWKISDVAVTGLLLDPRNPRLPRRDANLSQRELIEELIEHEDVSGLAKKFATEGYFPTEQLIVVQENGKRYVLEGNRRLAALKLLINPDVAPERYQSRFKVYARQVNVDIIKKVRVVTAPSRIAAAPIIRSKHTGEQVRRWKPIMQANLYKELLEDGMTVEDLTEEYSITPAQISDFLKMYEMYDVACHINFPEDIKDKVVDPRKFPMSTLERLYLDPNVQKFLGIHFDLNNGLIGNIDVDEFKKGYSKIISDLATNQIDSRKLNKAEDIKKYIDEIDDSQTPDITKKGKFTSAEIVSNSNVKLSEAKVEDDDQKKKSSVRKQSQSIIPRSFKCNVEDKRVNEVFSELKTLKIKSHKNTSGVMLRVLLELSIAAYLVKIGKYGDLIEQKRPSNTKNKRKWSPTLKQMLTYMMNDCDSVKANPKTVRAVNKLLSDENIVSIDTLDFIAHNEKFDINEDQLRSFWVTLQDVFSITLTEPQNH